MTCFDAILDKRDISNQHLFLLFKNGDGLFISSICNLVKNQDKYLAEDKAKIINFFKKFVFKFQDMNQIQQKWIKNKMIMNNIDYQIYLH